MILYFFKYDRLYHRVARFEINGYAVAFCGSQAPTSQLTFLLTDFEDLEKDKCIVCLPEPLNA